MPPVTIADSLQAPDPGVYDFERRRALIEMRRQALAKAMRDASSFQENPGRMVSGHYVAPSWAQGLNQVIAPAMDARRIEGMRQDIANDVGAFDAADRRAAIQHAMSRPGVAASGEDREGNPIVPPSTPQAMAQWAQQGAGIPSRRDVVSKIMADLEVNAPIRDEARTARAQDREDTQAFRQEQLRAQQQEAERARIERGEQLAADRVERARMEADRLADRQDARADRRALIASQVSARSVDPGKPTGKTLPAGTVKDMGELDERAATLSSMASSFKPEYAGPVAAAKGAVASYVPGMDTDGANWWRDYKKQQELIERHSLFGATLTQGEQSSWRAADISPSMQPEVIKRNLATRAKLADKVAEKALERYGAAGYNVEGLGRVRSTGGATGDFGGAPAQVRNAADYAKVPSGATYTDPNGQVRVKP